MMDFLKRSRSISLSPFEEAFFWVIDLDHIEKEEVEEAKKWLDDKALKYSSRYKFEKDRNRSILTHAILRAHLSQFLKIKPDQIELIRTQFDKPYIKNHPIHFNISHTIYNAFFAFHVSKPIGVDIEYVQEDDDILKLSEQFLHPKEKRWIECAADPVHAFYRFWCAKEAFLKAQGSGFLADDIPDFESFQEIAKGCTLFTNKKGRVYVYDGVISKHKLAVCIPSSLSCP